jgi:hypothetical protein
MLASDKDIFIQKIGKYTGVKNFDMQIAIKVISSQEENKVVQTELQTIKKMNNNYFFKNSTVTILRNDHCSLLIDDQLKFINYYPSVNNRKAKESAIPLDFFDQYKSALDSVLRKVEQNGSEMFTLTYKNKKSIYSRSEVTFDARGILKQITNVSAIGDVVEMTFPKYELEAIIPGENFNEKEYITNTGKEITVSQKYKKYLLQINQ